MSIKLAKEIKKRIEKLQTSNEEITALVDKIIRAVDSLKYK